MDFKLSGITNGTLVVSLIFLLGLLIYFTYPLPRYLLLIAGLVFVIGILWLYLSTRRSDEKYKFWKELFRDIGIACIVAVIVTLIYEASTRTLENQEIMLSGIDRTMAEFLPRRDWEEMRQEVMMRHRIRRNIDIEFKISRKARLSDGKYVTAPPGQVILWMKYGYDLYGIADDAAYQPVQHELAREMWNDEPKNSAI